MATPEGSVTHPGTSAGSVPPPEAGISKTLTSPTQGASVTTAGVHMPVIHIVGSLPVPVDEVEKILHTTSWDDQRNQASAFFDFLDRTAPVILRLNEGNQVRAALLNVPNTHPFKWRTVLVLLRWG